mmetsp:Transcript_33400/g.66495  ORF Transcript_33400/g.66495 Transcript_33400/m.66495 type:complete len:83 (+) Transcript_33400:585-833(+)
MAMSKKRRTTGMVVRTAQQKKQNWEIKLGFYMECAPRGMREGPDLAGCLERDVEFQNPSNTQQCAWQREAQQLTCYKTPRES